jgi:GAF domain-containing protein/DNA-binding LacI/PurR family transcriptional regulator
MSQGMWRGVVESARRRGASSVCFLVNPLQTYADLDAPSNALYGLPSANSLDGLIMWTALTHNLPAEHVDRLYERYESLPIVNVGGMREGIASVLVDNYQGMRDELVHLVKEHGYRQIVFVRGPETDAEARDRYRAYVDVMTQFGFAVDPDLVLPGNNQTASGTAAVQHLIDERHLRPGIDFEAVVGSNDNMAFGVLQALIERGCSVPEQVAVVGFDDVSQGQSLVPMTTVHYPFYEQGRRAADLVLDLIDGRDVPEQVTVPLEVVVRRSCGCLSRTVRMAGGSLLSQDVDRSDEAGLLSRQGVVRGMSQAARETTAHVSTGWPGRLLTALERDLGREQTDGFLSALDVCLQQVMIEGGEVDTWQNVLSVIQRWQIVAQDESKRERAQRLFQQARIMVGEAAQRLLVYQSSQESAFESLVADTRQALDAALASQTVFEILGRLSRLGVESFYAALYQDANDLDSGVRLVSAFDGKDTIPWDPDEVWFPSQYLVPSGVMDWSLPRILLVEPLYYGSEHQGFLLLELKEDASIRVGAALDLLRSHTSNALHRVALIEQEARARAEAEQARREAELALRDARVAQGQYMQDGWRSHLQSFEVASGYYWREGEHGVVSGQWLPAMKEAMRRRETIVDQDQDAGAAIAIPLRVSGQVIGVVGGHCPEGTTWNQDDLNILEVIVEQMALALDSQRLFQDLRQATRLMNERVRALGCLNDIGLAMEELSEMSELMTWITERIPAAMRYPDVCVSAVMLEGEVYGRAEATTLARNIVQGLRAGGELVGRIYVAYREDHDFSDEESALLGDIGRRLSGYIEGQRLLRETQEAARESAVLYELGQTLSAQLEMEQVLNEIYRGVCQLLDASNFYIGLYDRDLNQVVFPLNVTESVVDEHIQAIAADEGLTGYVLRTGESLLIQEDVAGWMRTHGIDAIGEPAQCWLGVPLVVGDAVQGVMAVQSYTTPHAYTTSHQDRLMSIAGQAAVALENARLFAQIQTRAQREQILRQITATVRDAPDQDSVLHTVVRELGRGMKRRVFIWLDGAKGQDHQPGGGSATSLSVAIGYLYDGVDVCPLEGDLEPKTGAVGERSDAADFADDPEAMVSPIQIQDERIGVLGIYQDPDHPFTQQDLDFVDAVAAQIAQALESVRLSRRTEEALAEARSLSQLAELVSSETDIDAICSSVSNVVVDRIGYAGCQVFVQDEDTATLQQIGLAVGAFDDWQLPAKAGHNLARAVLSRGSVVVVNEAADDDLYVGVGGEGQSHSRLAAAPLAGEEGIIGAICVSRPVEEPPITEQDARLLEAIALQTANALQRARLLQRMQDALAAADTATRRYIHDAWEDFVGRGRDTLQTYVAEPDGVSEAGDVILSEMEQALRCGEAVSIVTDEEHRGDRTFPMRSALAIPLRARGQVIGVVDFFREETTGGWTDRERELVEGLVEEIGESLESERQFQQTQITLAETERMYRASQRISAAQSSAEVVNIVLDTTFETGADQSAVFVFDRPATSGAPQSQSLVAFRDRNQADPPVPIGAKCSLEDYPLVQALDRDRPLTVPDLVADDQLAVATREMLVQQGFRALAAISLSVGLEWLGYAVVLRRSPHVFTEGEMRVLESIGDQAATALRSARLYTEAQRRARREQLIREITSKMRGTPDLDTILNTAVKELGKALGVSRAFVRLGTGSDGEMQNKEEVRDAPLSDSQEISS